MTTKTKPWVGVEVVDIRKIVGDGNIKAFADVKFEIAADADHEEALVMKGFVVMKGKSGLDVLMPRKPARDGKWFDMVTPCSENLRKVIEEKILEAYKKEI